ncbi:PEP-CTERM sorting domain-containing protein [Aquabacterium sp. A7-Y]|nr:PEP-CTERM sorting domain-containing protein [Aquabacterium sp. A7-Y]MCW7541025.1 PEP-CTERM sorting domain-containing protein [Aquabacterium sp. A7-Y]
MVAPVPEPGTYVLLLAGLGAVAVGARKRRGPESRI